VIAAIHWPASTSTSTSTSAPRATNSRFHTIIRIKTRAEQFAKAARALGIGHTMRPFRNRWRHLTADRGSKRCRKPILPVRFEKRLLRKKSGRGHFRYSYTFRSGSHLHKDVVASAVNLGIYMTRTSCYSEFNGHSKATASSQGTETSLSHRRAQRTFR